MPVRRALLSCSDRTGLLDFARGLVERGVELIASGGTGQMLAEAGLPVTPVEAVTGSPEMMEGRVKTLHPKIHGGLLADRSKPEHLRQAEEHGIGLIDLVAVNLYPFRETVADPNVTLDEAIEKIDIGGPSMIRSAAKNWKSVAVLVDPGDYAPTLQSLQADGDLSDDLRLRLATKAFAHTAAYDAAIHAWFEGRGAGGFPETVVLGYERAQTLRYGENPHQPGAFYRETPAPRGSIGNARQHSGRELSFINLLDADAALNLVREFADPAAAVIKHMNPCGCAAAPRLDDAFAAARDADPMSRFGGIIALNRPLDLATAEQVTVKNSYYEVLIAPGFEPDALEHILRRKGWGEKIRLLEVEPFDFGAAGASRTDRAPTWDLKRVTGGLLIQERDQLTAADDDWTVVSDRAPSEDEAAALRFAWRVCAHVKSNAIVLARCGLNPDEPDGAAKAGVRMVGMGAGQPNRVLPVRLAIEQANDLAKGAVLASDAFFPKPDGPETAALAGITAIIQPGGSVEDDKAVEVCNQYGMAMVFTGRRHFRH